MFGLGGWFPMTPLQFLISIAPTVAVTTEVRQIVAASFSSALAHLKQRTVDLKVGVALPFSVGNMAGNLMPCAVPPFAGTALSASYRHL